jgi:hypothetical protein
LQEEFANFKEAHASQSAVYEKEVRKARKEAFKNSSMVLKIQEELKSTRSSLRITQSGLDMEKRKLAQRDQETFNAQYQLAAVQEELDKLKAQIQIVEDEKNALKTSLKEEEVARIAAEGMIALPAALDDDELMGTPRRRSPAKRSASPLSDDKENAGVITKKMLDSRRFDEELARERTRREHAEELAEFLRLECYFRCCPCRASDHAGHDQHLSVAGELGQAFESIRTDMRAVLTPAASVDEDNNTMIVQKAPNEEVKQQREHDFEIELQQEESPDVEMEQDDMAADDLDRSLTMLDDPAPEPTVEAAPEDPSDVEAGADDDKEEPEQETLQAPRHTPAVQELEFEEEEEVIEVQTQKVPLAPSSPPSRAHSPSQTTTPYRSIRTYTTTIPMKFTPRKPSFERAGSHTEDEQEEQDAEHIPHPADPISPRERTTSAPAFDRAAALAAIAYRRGRAKSIADGQAATPRKQMLEGVSMHDRRDVSAPVLGQKSTGASAHKGAASVGRGTVRGRLM